MRSLYELYKKFTLSFSRKTSTLIEMQVVAKCRNLRPALMSPQKCPPNMTHTQHLRKSKANIVRVPYARNPSGTQRKTNSQLTQLKCITKPTAQPVLWFPEVGPNRARDWGRRNHQHQHQRIASMAAPLPYAICFVLYALAIYA